MKEKGINESADMPSLEILKLIAEGKRLTDNVEAYAAGIFNLIVDNSVAGHERLIHIFETAKKRYSEECRTKGRLEEFDTALQDITTYQNYIIWLQTVKSFIAKGNWNENSASPILLFQLLYSAGYKLKSKEGETEASLLPLVLKSFKKNLSDLVDKSVLAYQRDEKDKERKKQELEALREVKIGDVTNILLYESNEEAKANKLMRPEKDVFSLIYTSEGWRLNWYDVLGHPNFLPIDSDFRRILNELDGNKLPERTLNDYKKIKTYCTRALKKPVFLFDDIEQAKAFVQDHPEQHSFYLNRVPSKELNVLKWQLYWIDLQGKKNPLLFDDEKLKNEGQLPSTETELHYDIQEVCKKAITELLNQMRLSINPEANGSSSKLATYVLTHSPAQSKLEWVDSIGISKEIDLSNYSALNTWLVESRDFSKKENLDQLKLFLLHLNPNTRREVDEAKQKNAQKILLKRPDLTGITLHVTNGEIPRFKLTPGIYILKRESNEWVLYQRQKKEGNVLIDVSTNEWDKFREVLIEQGNAMPDELSAETKSLIRVSIEAALAASEKNTKDNLRCIAVNDFQPEQSIQYKASSFILTAENNEWALYYLNVFQKSIRVNLNDCPLAKELLSDWRVKPQSLTLIQLNELNKALINFTPVTPLNKAAFIEVEKFFARRHIKAPDPELRKPILHEQGEDYAALKRVLLTRFSPKREKIEPQKIDKKRIGDFATMFGSVVKTVNREVVELENKPSTKIFD